MFDKCFNFQCSNLGHFFCSLYTAVVNADMHEVRIRSPNASSTRIYGHGMAARVASQVWLGMGGQGILGARIPGFNPFFRYQ